MKATLLVRNKHLPDLFSLLLKQCLLLRNRFKLISLTAVHIDDFIIFTVIYSSLHGFITNQHNDQLPVGLLAEFVEH